MKKHSPTFIKSDKTNDQIAMNRTARRYVKKLYKLAITPKPLLSPKIGSWK